VHDIFSLQREPNLLETKLLEWQITKRRAEEWLEDRKKKKGDENDDLPEAVGNSRIRRWFSNVKRDIKSFRSHVLTKSDPRLVHELLRNQQTSLKARRMSNVDSNEYDIAVVLTGLNDLKDMCLPFMTRGANSGTTDEAREQASNDGIKGELMRVLAALKERMRLPEAVQNTTGIKDQGPLVVFPALPNLADAIVSQRTSLMVRCPSFRYD
jgi:hypothetical protein